MESVQINIEPEKEAMVPRPSPDTETAALADGILGRAEESLLPEYRGNTTADVAEALASIQPAADVTVGADETGTGPTAVGADGGDAFTEALEDATTGGRGGADDGDAEARERDDGGGPTEETGGFGFGFDESDESDEPDGA
jgi:flagellar protein FlaI